MVRRRPDRPGSRLPHLLHLPTTDRFDLPANIARAVARPRIMVGSLRRLSADNASIRTATARRAPPAPARRSFRSRFACRPARQRLTPDELLDAAQARITIDGYDPAAVLGAALEYMAETWAEEERPLCSTCGRRRVGRGRSECLWCEQNREAMLLHKRRWWNSHGNEWRAERRATDAGVVSIPAVEVEW